MSGRRSYGFFSGRKPAIIRAAAVTAKPMSQTAKSKITEVHYEPDCPPEKVTQVLSALDRSSGRSARNVTHLRATDRHAYRTTVIIEPNESPASDEPLVRQVFHVPTRNVSKTGLGFVAPPVFRPSSVSDATPFLRSEIRFRVGTQIKVKLGPPTGKVPTLSAVITRLRPVQFGFFDVGVRFMSHE
jgi:hypothetical protein